MDAQRSRAGEASGIRRPDWSAGVQSRSLVEAGNRACAGGKVRSSLNGRCALVRTTLDRRRPREGTASCVHGAWWARWAWSPPSFFTHAGSSIGVRAGACRGRPRGGGRHAACRPLAVRVAVDAHRTRASERRVLVPHPARADVTNAGESCKRQLALALALAAPGRRWLGWKRGCGRWRTPVAVQE